MVGKDALVTKESEEVVNAGEATSMAGYQNSDVGTGESGQRTARKRLDRPEDDDIAANLIESDQRRQQPSSRASKFARLTKSDDSLGT